VAIWSPTCCIPDTKSSLFEANDYPGGHTNTVEFEAWGRTVGSRHGIHGVQPADVSPLPASTEAARRSLAGFGHEFQRPMRADGPGVRRRFVERSCSPSGRICFGPAFIGMLRDILRFNRRSARRGSDQHDDTMTLGQFLERHRFGRPFVERYLIPMTAAIWSARPRAVLEFPGLFPDRFLPEPRSATDPQSPSLEDRTRAERGTT
jgi:uncharacterized protein